MEIWKNIPGFEGLYEASTHGRIRRICSTSICHRKLSQEQVTQIRALITQGTPSQRKIALQFGVTNTVVRRIARGTAYREAYEPVVLTPSLNAAGYPFVVLCKGGITKTRTVHCLILLTFFGPRPPPPNHFINHLDGIKTNAALTNLEYTSPKGNAVHAADILRAVGKLSAKDVEEIRALKGKERQRLVAKRYGVSVSAICNIWCNKTWNRHYPRVAGEYPSMYGE